MDTAPQPGRARRRLPRWAWALIVLVLLAGGWALVFRLRNGPHLPVVIQRLPADTQVIVFSANGLGYPAAIERHSPAALGGWVIGAYWLTDDGAPTKFKFRANGTTIISPNRQVAVDRDVELNPRDAGLVWRNGVRSELTVPPPSKAHWLFPTDAGGVHDGVRRYYEAGRCVVTLPPGYRFFQSAQCADPRFLPVAGPLNNPIFHGGNLNLYDLQQKTIISLSLSEWGGGPCAIFHHGTRFLVASGVPAVIDPWSLPALYKPPVKLTMPPAIGASWWWGEDGTTWITGGGVSTQVYDWRHGPPVLHALPYQSVPDQRIRESPYLWYSPGSEVLSDRPASGIAVWGDSRLVACVKTQRTLPQPIARLCDKSSLTKNIPREVRELVLYRNGRRAGWYRLPLDLTVKSLPDPRQYISIPYIRGFKPKPPPLILAREHLAFTRDGTRLAWVVETSKGKTIYVFKVPQ